MIRIVFQIYLKNLLLRLALKENCIEVSSNKRFITCNMAYKTAPYEALEGKPKEKDSLINQTVTIGELFQKIGAIGIYSVGGTQ